MTSARQPALLHSAGSIPTEHRMRRLRRSDGLRRMVRETRLSPSDFIYPVFVTVGRDVREPIPSMPGQSRLSVDQLAQEAVDAVLVAEGKDLVLLVGEAEDVGAAVIDADAAAVAFVGVDFYHACVLYTDDL